MDEKKLENLTEKENSAETTAPQKLSETWAQDALQDLEDWIEEQGIYIRQ